MAWDAAEMITMAEMMGIATHGLARVENYVDRLRAGGMNPKAEPQITAPAPALLKVDGYNGLGAAVALRAMQAAMNAARKTGIAAAFCRRSTHLGALAPLLWIAASDGFAAIITTNTAPMIAPAGGRTAVLGNAPLGFALICSPGGCRGRR
jgi:LDH2 family malate/lactate/ureidoglycolate dehydrogenase